MAEEALTAYDVVIEDLHDNDTQGASLVPDGIVADLIDDLKQTKRTYPDIGKQIVAQPGELDRLRKENRRMRGVLKPLAQAGDMEEDAPAAASVMVNVNRLRDARTLLSEITQKEA